MHSQYGAAAVVLIGLLAGTAAVAQADNVQLGPRPFYLVDQMDRSELKRELRRCAASTRRYVPSDFSIGHRGAALQFPEHTAESYIAAARQGAGILECDMAVTADGELVCRHAECDLHTTTNILATDLAAKCEQGFQPAVYDEDGNLVTPASARCCTSDITVNEFKTLVGKMDAADSGATTVEEYLGGTADFRTDLYTTGARLLTHAESIELFQRLGRKMTPELKTYNEEKGILTYDAVRQKVIDEYRAAGVPAQNVWLQSFNLPDVEYWIESAPDFGEQAVYLEGRDPVELVNNPPPLEEFEALKAMGVNILAPPMPALLTTDGNEIVPSEYAVRARQAGLGLISWTIERSGRVNEDIIPSGGAFYYNTTVDVLRNDGDIMRTMDVLVQQVGIFGLFSDWPATTTFYANCKDIPELN
jgi:glycerophosphoryl diester phosphodiesterase